ncbi:transglutaminase-like domain-containing protein [Zavarzinella formosa]|uniref:transglutaminase-like domain-containing protein n=1 Tax=Zavarzinella formosa TaxID=360055 RepID=UPI0002DC7B95|nr:transglutaminase-like domain-containing protein [Zavarzinella formosa]
MIDHRSLANRREWQTRFRRVMLALVFCWPTSAAFSVEPAADKGKTVSFTIQYTITATDKTDKVVLTTLVPVTIPGKQKISQLQFSTPPQQQFEEDGRKYAVFVFTDFKKPVTIQINAVAEIYRNDLTVIADRARDKKIPDEATSRWLAHEKNLEKDSAAIKEVAKTFVKSGDMETVEEILVYLEKTVKYGGFSQKDRGALGTLGEKRGDCGDFSDLFVALCRAKGIPARICDGYVTEGVPKGDTPSHTWAEVRINKLGWVPVDPLGIVLKGTTLKTMPNKYVHMSNIRNDDHLLGNHLVVYRYFGKPIDFKDAFIVK